MMRCWIARRGAAPTKGWWASFGPRRVLGFRNLVREAAAPRCSSCSTSIEDPHNVGAILRTADAAGAHGVIRQTRRAAPLGPVVTKASAGAIAHVKMAAVVNIARALEELKAAGV